MIREYVEPKQYVLNERDAVSWGMVCRQAERSVHRGKRSRGGSRKTKQSKKVRFVLWLAEQAAGAIAGVVAFATVWDSLAGSVDGHMRTALASAPALTAWVLMVLLIRWAPTNRLAFLLDR
jgi:hypothetical protein